MTYKITCAIADCGIAPTTEVRQYQFSGRVALGLDPA